MARTNDGGVTSTGSAKAEKKPYSTPRLERFGTIRELTQGPGSNNRFDGQHPPGQNKSRF